MKKIIIMMLTIVLTLAAVSCELIYTMILNGTYNIDGYYTDEDMTNGYSVNSGAQFEITYTDMHQLDSSGRVTASYTMSELTGISFIMTNDSDSDNIYNVQYYFDEGLLYLALYDEDGTFYRTYKCGSTYSD